MSALLKRAHMYDIQLGLDLGTKVEAQEISDTWELDVQMLRLVGNDVDFAGMMRGTCSVATTMRQEMKEIVHRGHDFTTLRVPTTIFKLAPNPIDLESGIDFFKDVKVFGNEFDFNDAILRDGRNGWSSLFQGAVDRIDVRGSHDEFFVHEENIKLLAKHLQKLLESNGGRTRGDQLAASEEVCAPLWNVAGG